MFEDDEIEQFGMRNDRRSKDNCADKCIQKHPLYIYIYVHYIHLCVHRCEILIKEIFSSFFIYSVFSVTSNTCIETNKEYIK